LADFKASDEGTHPAGSREHWNESFYLNFFDPQRGWGAVSRIGFSPNRGFADGFVCLYLPDGSTRFIPVWEPCSDHRGRSSAGAVEHVCLEPFRRWRVGYRGPIYQFLEPASMGDSAPAGLAELPGSELELELEFQAIHGAFDFHDSMRRDWLPAADLLAKLKPGYLFEHLGPGLRKLALLRTMSGAQHYEHAGRIEGSIRLDGELTRVAGIGQRDHSWGVRDMRVPANWRWFSGQLGEELCFNAISVEVLGLRASGGYLYHRGKAEALRSWSHRAELEAPRRGPKRVSLELVGYSGRRFELEGTALANIPVIVHTGSSRSVVNEAHTLFTWGEKSGHGVSEFMEQLPR
jgi:hypothetical protein